jgi:hypothetical protein
MTEYPAERIAFWVNGTDDGVNDTQGVGKWPPRVRDSTLPFAQIPFARSPVSSARNLLLRRAQWRIFVIETIGSY